MALDHAIYLILSVCLTRRNHSTPKSVDYNSVIEPEWVRHGLKKINQNKTLSLFTQKFLRK